MAGNEGGGGEGGDGSDAGAEGAVIEMINSKLLINNEHVIWKTIDLITSCLNYRTGPFHRQKTMEGKQLARSFCQFCW